MGRPPPAAPRSMRVHWGFRCFGCHLLPLLRGQLADVPARKECLLRARGILAIHPEGRAIIHNPVLVGLSSPEPSSSPMSHGQMPDPAGGPGHRAG